MSLCTYNALSVRQKYLYCFDSCYLVFTHACYYLLSRMTYALTYGLLRAAELESMQRSPSIFDSAGVRRRHSHTRICPNQATLSAAHDARGHESTNPDITMVRCRSIDRSIDMHRRIDDTRHNNLHCHL